MGSSRQGYRRASTTLLTRESAWTTDPLVSPLFQQRRLEPRDSARAGALPRSSTSDLADFLRNSGPDVPPPIAEDGTGLGKSLNRTSRSAWVENGPHRAGEMSQEMARSNSTTLRQVPRATTSQLDDPGRAVTKELTELLREPAARSVSLNDLAKKVPREAASPRVRQGLGSPLLELADLIRHTGPGDYFLSSPSTPASKPIARQASTPRLQQHEMSPSMELVAFMRETGPSGPSSSSSSPRLSNGGFSILPSEVTIPRRQGLHRSPTLDSVELLRDAEPSRSQPGRSSIDPFVSARPPSAASNASTSGKGEGTAQDDSSPRASMSSTSRMIARGAKTVGSPEILTEEEEEDGRPSRRAGMTLVEAIRDGPPPGFSGGLASSTSAPAGFGSSSQSLNRSDSPNNRASKRWTMSGMGSKLLNRASPTDAGINSSTVQGDRRSTDSRASAQWEIVPAPPRPALEPAAPVVPPQPPLASTPLPPHDFKQSSSSLHPIEHPTLPASSQLPPDAHPANVSRSP